MMSTVAHGALVTKSLAINDNYEEISYMIPHICLYYLPLLFTGDIFITFSGALISLLCSFVFVAVDCDHDEWHFAIASTPSSNQQLGSHVSVQSETLMNKKGAQFVIS
ncbi:hypothetical protein AVEN_28179-1 [Araneus ventricosus]|uniref:Uncharacterized protein n=1 Tax=Araneus ventricosus TaxID=182803 RepID=A0A4Y2ICF9_ARAVE|nr:hypothetical protein AVEN_28179-1 [Araneus ventricosus]